MIKEESFSFGLWNVVKELFWIIFGKRWIMRIGSLWLRIWLRCFFYFNF